MSKLAESYRSHVQSATQDGPQVQALRDEYPLVVEAMRGVVGDETTPTLWPCTVMLFLEGDQLKFCLNPKSGNRVAFGSVADASKGLLGVEQALFDGHFEWKARGRSR